MGNGKIGFIGTGIWEAPLLGQPLSNPSDLLMLTRGEEDQGPVIGGGRHVSTNKGSRPAARYIPGVPRIIKDMLRDRPVLTTGLTVSPVSWPFMTIDRI